MEREEVKCDSFVPNNNDVLIIYLEKNSGSSVGRGLDWGLKGCKFETHCKRSHCVLSLSKTLYLLLSTGSTQEDPSRHD